MSEPRIAEEFILPSRGLIYDDPLGVEFEGILSSMKAKHEMLRLSSTEENHKIMSDILDDCIESDLGMSAYDLCLGDYQYLLFQLRIVTFGPEYTMRGRCPFCGFEQNVTVNLDELESKAIDEEEYFKLMTVKLPISGNEIKITYQTPRMLDRINTRVKEYQRRHRDSEENPVLLFNIMSVIEEIDGEEPNRVFLEDWIKDLPLQDAIAIINNIDKMNNSIGMNLLYPTTCKICGTDYYMPFRINDTFFRPNS